MGRKSNNLQHRHEWAQSKGFKDYYEYLEDLAKRKGFNSYKDYKDSWTKNKGFHSHNDYGKFMKWENNESNPANLNKECASYLGLCISENAVTLSGILNNLEKKNNKTEGYDLVWDNKYKVDIKSKCLNLKYNTWSFSINYNTIADYFLLIAFDNRTDINPLHIWPIKGEEIIKSRIRKNRKLNEKESLTIYNTEKSLNRFKEYELVDQLEIFKIYCKEIKECENNA